MQSMRFWFIFFLFPAFIFAMTKSDYKDRCEKALQEWNKCSKLIEQANHLPANESEKLKQILTAAIQCCQKAIEHYDFILNTQSDNNRWKRDSIKTSQKNKEICAKQLSSLQINLDNFLFEEVEALYNKSLDLGDLAKQKESSSSRRPNNSDDVASSLIEAAMLYEQAALFATQALSLLSIHRASDRNLVSQAILFFQDAVQRCKNETPQWSKNIFSQKVDLKRTFELLKEESRFLQEKGFKHNSLELQKEMMSILKKLTQFGAVDEKEAEENLAELEKSFESFEKEADSKRLTENIFLISFEEFDLREKKRRAFFFENPPSFKEDLFLPVFFQNEIRPFAVPLDGQKGSNEKKFTLLSDRFYRFLIQSDRPYHYLNIKVYEKETLVHEEKVDLPNKNSPSWEHYLIRDGMLFIPETKLKNEFGLDLRLTFVPDPDCNFSLVIAEKGVFSQYHFSISFDEEIPLYECEFTESPPWQLKELFSLKIAKKSFDKTSLKMLSLDDANFNCSLPLDFSILDKFVEEMKNDPLLLAQYVYDQIDLVDPFLYMENGVFIAPLIYRNPLITFLEKQGSPWEQCQLLVYLLRKAGYKAIYANGEPYSVPKSFIKNIFYADLDDKNEVLVNYPWVLFLDGDKWISIFPWMKEIEIKEGQDLYSLMPQQYASIDRWIAQYLKGDEKILKHIGTDKDDTAGALFMRFVEEELRKQGLSLSDVGIERIKHKKEIHAWEDFPHPFIEKDLNILFTLENEAALFAKMEVLFYPEDNPTNQLKIFLPLGFIKTSDLFIKFINRENFDILQITTENGKEFYLNLSPNNQKIEIKVTGKDGFYANQIQTFSILKNTTALLSFNFGGANGKFKPFDESVSVQDEEKHIYNLLAYMSTTYFEKCARMDKKLSDIHKVLPSTICAFGLSKLSPPSCMDNSKVMLPQVDMFWFSSDSSVSYKNTRFFDKKQYNTLCAVDHSSSEHQIITDLFQDPYAISTVKLLKLAHIKEQIKGSENNSFEAKSSYNVTNEEEKHTFDNHHFYNTVKKVLDPQNLLSDFAYAYLTPGKVQSQDSTYEESAALILSPYEAYALISCNNSNGGLGSAQPYVHVSSFVIQEYGRLTYGTFFTDSVSSEVSGKYDSDVRGQHKSLWNTVADPVDVVSGAFYIDEIDLSIFGPFPIEIRRNYNSQNLIESPFGYGWKINLNPRLVEQDGKLYASEEDGTVIVYSYNPKNSKWEVLAEENPDLSNFNKEGIGSTANPFHAYIENNILYGSDGSKRIFEDGLLQKWIDSKGNTLTFLYENERLSGIESSNGNFCGFRYNYQGRISEIYSKDGYIISYLYNNRGDLTEVTLPNSTINYEYDRLHRIYRETKPHGRVLENVFDEQGRVIEQRSPMGPAQEIIPTAKFDYRDGMTVVTDATGGTTTYKIFKKQIYKITDPLGHQTFLSWFIDEKSWFDPQTESVLDWDKQGGYPRSLKSSIDKRGLTTSYLYDNHGNPTEITLQGNDLTGDGKTEISKKFTYNAQNLCTEEKIANQTTLTSYDLSFSYLPKRIEKYRDDTLISYIQWEYDPKGQIEKEDHSGSKTVWKYEDRGFPIEKIQITNTDDPDLITEYSYNIQGKCIQKISADSIQKDSYDLMGNLIESQIFAPSGSLISANYMSYNRNNQLVSQQGANSENILYLDYNAAGAIKGSKEICSATNSVTYNIYVYDSRGNLIQEINPLGHSTYRNYDSLGRVIKVTLDNLETNFYYEPGGLIEATISPSGAKRTYHYTTNGLLKEEIYPDGSQISYVYDFWGRIVQETKNGISWKIEYDDANHRVIRTHLDSKMTDIQEFDARGNLIRFTDGAGYSSDKTYDGLDRLKSKTTPTGEKTTWDYEKNQIICSFTNDEKEITRYEGGKLVESKILNDSGEIIEHTTFKYDPKEDIEEMVKGDVHTIVRMNGSGLPIKTQKGDISNFYEYDLCGNCIASIDGEGRKVSQYFDPLGRLIKKVLSDGASIEYAYDLDSNLIECHFPNKTFWKAAYDSMGRKSFEELRSGERSVNHWEYTYESGYLKEMKDPMNRIHFYSYDSLGRVCQDSVDGWHRTYTYDPRGLLLSLEQKKENNSSGIVSCFYLQNDEHSLIERAYDSDGRLILESVYLNSNLIQQAHQGWSPSGRTLKIDGHEREFIYQNNCLVRILAKNIDLSYSYDLSGALKSKRSPLNYSNIDYNSSSLPQKINMHLINETYQEVLDWNKSGKLSFYSDSKVQKEFTYNRRGFLQSAGEERYEFDFGKEGTGVRTFASNVNVPSDGLDFFGRIITEVINEEVIATSYDAMGQVVSHGQKTFDWDPWGRLLKVTDSSVAWEASYDGLGRRLQTRHSCGWRSTKTITSLYDPEEEFQEIGVKCDNKTFWKFFGDNAFACDALTDEKGGSVFLIWNGIGNLSGVVTEQGFIPCEEFLPFYGEFQNSEYSISVNLLEMAQSLKWHSKSQDPTGLIWLGKRYYDPKGGRFLSADPIGYPQSLDLYAYADGDPVNYLDLDGRFASHAYQTTRPVLIDAFRLKGYEVFTKSFNAVSSFCANHGFTGSGVFQAGLFDLSNGAIGFINGINNKETESEGSAQYLSEFARGSKIYGIYNATNKIDVDVFECAIGEMGLHTPPVQLLKNQWNHFIVRHGPEAKFLQICHSGGAVHVKNALLTSSESIQQRIIVLAIAPAVIVPKSLCFKSRNYMSRRDFVTRLDIVGNLKYGNELEILEPHPVAKIWDHEFVSPTFTKTLQYSIDDFFENYGGKK